MPAKGWLENFFLLLKFTWPKHRKILDVSTSNFKDLLKPLVGIKWAKKPRKPNHEAENFFAPAKGWLENYFLLLKLTWPKHRKKLEVPRSNLKYHL